MYPIIATPLAQTQEKEFVCALFLIFVAQIVKSAKKTEAVSSAASFTHNCEFAHFSYFL